MLGKDKEVDTVPFFWTMQYGKSIRYAGIVFTDGTFFSQEPS